MPVQEFQLKMGRGYAQTWRGPCWWDFMMYMYILLTICRGGDTGVASQLSSVDIDTVLCTLIKALDQVSNDVDNSMEEG